VKAEIYRQKYFTRYRKIHSAGHAQFRHRAWGRAAAEHKRPAEIPIMMDKGLCKDFRYVKNSPGWLEAAIL